MKNIHLLCISCLITFVACNSTNKNNVEIFKKNDKAIIAYVAGFRGLIDADKISVPKITHINYAFVDVQEGKAHLTNEATDTINFRLLNELKQQKPDLKILISIGGWTWSGNFSDAVLTAERRRLFARSAVDIIKKNNLDGIDIDWEYPAVPGNEGNIYRPEDKQNYTLMFEAIRAELDVLGKETNKKYMLTTAVGGFQNFIDNTEMRKVQQYLDYINIMTYDNASNGLASHHTNLYSSEKYDSDQSADIMVKAYTKAGVPVEKLVMGVAFYGRTYVLHDGASSDGIGSPVIEQIEGNGYTYIKDFLVNRDGYIRYWDKSASAPYLFNADKNIFITYDDEESVKAKCEYVLDNEMGGVMFWEYSSDPKEYLLNEINTVLNIGTIHR